QCVKDRRKVVVAEVLSGFFIIWLIIAVGYGVGRTDALGPNAQPVLSRLAFFVASPALLFNTLSESDVFLVLGPQLWIATLSAGIAALVYLALAKFLVAKRSGSERMIAALSASMINSANLGLPIAAYVLAVPVMRRRSFCFSWPSTHRSTCSSSTAKRSKNPNRTSQGSRSSGQVSGAVWAASLPLSFGTL